MENQNERPFEIDRSQLEASRIAYIVLMCLAAILPISAVIAISIVFKYRSLQRKRKQFANSWNYARLVSFRKNNILNLIEPTVSQISSSHLDVFYPSGRRNNLPDKQKLVSIFPPKNSSKTSHNFSGGYVEGSGTIEESRSYVKETRDSFVKTLLTQRTSARVNNSGKNSIVKNTIIQIIKLNNDNNTIETTTSHQSNDTTINQGMDRMSSDKLDHSYKRIIENKKNENQLKPFQTIFSELSNNSSNIEEEVKSREINSTKPNTSPLVKSSLNASILIKSQNTDSVENVETTKSSARDFDSRSKSTLLTEFDYFTDPILSKNSLCRYGRCVGNSLTPKTCLKCKPIKKFYNINNNLKNPLYEENDDDYKSEGVRDLEFYKTHGDSTLEFKSGRSIKLVEGLSKLHRSPGSLDLNKILESDDAINNSFDLKNQDNFTYSSPSSFLEDHILPPPPMFCDSSLKLSRNSRTTSPKLPQNPHILLKHKLPTISTISNNETSVFDNLPKVEAKNTFSEYRSLSHKTRKTQENEFTEDTILKEEALALKYFEDICKELSSDSLNPSEDDDVRDNRYYYRPVTHLLTGNIKPINQNANNEKPLQPNFRKSYEHLLSPDYPYERRKIISSELTNGGFNSSNLDEIKIADDLTTNVNKVKSQVKCDWIVTHM